MVSAPEADSGMDDDVGLQEMVALPPGVVESGMAQVSISAQMWDTWCGHSFTWALKELLDNSFSKAEADWPKDVVPWNATRIEVSVSPGGDNLLILDNGRGLTMEQFAIGFHRLGHTDNTKPGEMQTAAISQFGTGGKMADASLSTYVKYIMRHRDDPSIVVEAEAGKDVSEELRQNDLTVRHQRWTDTSQYLSAVQEMVLEGSTTETEFTMVKQLVSQFASGFMRSLKLRSTHTSRLRAGPANTILYQGSKDVDIADHAARNYLFPVSTDGDGGTAARLQPAGYYQMPLADGLYSPRLVVAGEEVPWSRNPILGGEPAHMFDVFDAEAGTGTAPALRVAIRYLKEKDPDSGVAFYLGCRRVCDASDPHNYYYCPVMGKAHNMLNFASKVTDWAVMHHTHKKLQGCPIGPAEYMGDLKEQATHLLASTGPFKGKAGHFMVFRGVHMAIVLPPGSAGLTEDKQNFLPDKKLQDNVEMALREALKWMLSHPPPWLEAAFLTHAHTCLRPPCCGVEAERMQVQPVAEPTEDANGNTVPAPRGAVVKREAAAAQRAGTRTGPAGVLVSSPASPAAPAPSSGRRTAAAASNGVAATLPALQPESGRKRSANGGVIAPPPPPLLGADNGLPAGDNAGVRQGARFRKKRAYGPDYLVDPVAAAPELGPEPEAGLEPEPAVDHEPTPPPSPPRPKAPRPTKRALLSLLQAGLKAVRRGAHDPEDIMSDLVNIIQGQPPETKFPKLLLKNMPGWAGKAQEEEQQD